MLYFSHVWSEAAVKQTFCELLIFWEHLSCRMNDQACPHQETDVAITHFTVVSQLPKYFKHL